MLVTEEDGIVERIKLAQQKDEHVQAIKKILDSEEYKDYYLKHDILFKYENGLDLLVVPRAMQMEVIRKIHETGHVGVKKTEEIVKKEFCINKLKEKIQRVIESCVPCILGSKKEGKREGLLHPLSKQEGPLHTYHADYLGPLPSTNKNYQHLLAVIDSFTKFTWLYPTRSTTAHETVMNLKKQSNIFGNPVRIITDRGTSFTANEFTDYCSEEGIQHSLVTSGVPRGNGQIERQNRTIIPILTKLSLEDPNKWFKYVDRVQRILNSTFQRSINTTPFELLIGVRMRNKEDMLIKELIEQEIITQFDKNREELRAKSKEQLVKIQQENKGNYNKKRKKARLYGVGDVVAIKTTQFGGGLKLRRKYLGPYEVTRMHPNERYDVVKIGDHEGPIHTSTCAEYMKPWVFEESGSESDP